MKLFTVGPVEMQEDILQIGAEPLPYFRTAEFSEKMLKIEQQFKQVVNAPPEARLTILTASGTGAMEAAVCNLLSSQDKALVIDGGSFGHRFAQICQCFHIPFETIKLPFGQTLTAQQLAPYAHKGFTALLVNLHETSTGQLYDINLLSRFCQENGLLFIVDAISTLLADPFDMAAYGVNAVITASQKALALAPGLSFLITDGRANERIAHNPTLSVYFDLKDYLKNMERGQTPFTPAVGIILQLEKRLQEITAAGVGQIIQQHRMRAEYFRNACQRNGITVASYPKSNALTPLIFPQGNAYDVFLQMKEKFGLMLTPNGGELAGSVLRVGHLGNLSLTDYDLVVNRLKEILP